MASLIIRSTPLKGRILAQPSKSMAHRAIICAALANGESHIDNLVLSDDITATIGAVEAIGANVTISDSQTYHGRKKVCINSNGRVVLTGRTIDCCESGSTARFIMPITRLSNDPICINGRGRLVERPFSLYKELFTQKGVKFNDFNGRMPIELSGKLIPGDYFLPGNVSSQFISGLLFALPLMAEQSTVKITSALESLPYIQMTLNTLQKFGVIIEHSDDYLNYTIPGGQDYKPISNYTVEGDWSQAAFFCVMGAISNSVTVDGLRSDSLQGDKVILKILESMGCRIAYDEKGITFSASCLKGTEIDVSQCPDLVPAISVAASIAEGTTTIINAARLRIKESDRLLTTSSELSKLGADIKELPEGLIIDGVPNLNGAKTNGCGDHRIVMAIAAASAICKGNIIIDGCEAVKKSYPEFWQDFQTLGGIIENYE